LFFYFEETSQNENPKSYGGGDIQLSYGPPDVRTPSSSEGVTHPGLSVVACFLEKENLYCFFYSEETPQNKNPESSGIQLSYGPPETLHSETDLPKDRRQQHSFSNNALAHTTEKALPEVNKEAGVAHSPEEKTSRNASNGIPSTSKVQDRDFSQTHATTESASVAPSPLPSVPDKNTTAASSTNASHPIIPNTTARTYPLASDGVKFKGVPLSKGFQQELVDQEQSSSLSSPTENHERQKLEQGRSDVATNGHGSEVPVADAAAVAPGPPNGSGSSHHAEHEHETHRKKPGFMNKLKEEVKGISGRLSHKKGDSR
jgi:hypothetical protein